ncbi:hypothetical protein CHLRE_17g730100v5 [Chlamydomonas reinhardtii]|uniref:Peptidase M50 domain-containing protein n=1 Tax=Chlamydomonas reinhardtii TaxID=3055 RepID=A0A2K3CQX0_CHLRE|nr:uncharacterized protein CHLRE_17g730100v5 [Chlamydomonas reinhardtii]PNW70680.1 hypothetical protein CHLRE_17g730100v5 [Chlamydomonas reinhardtii]
MARGTRSLARTDGLGSRPFAAEHLSAPAFGFSASSAAGLGFAVLGLGFLCGGSEPGGMATALSAAALLNGALLAHEAGHLAAARALGVAVGEFAVGVGPRVAWWQGATGTTYSLRAFPLFGYVTFPSAAQLGPQGLAALQAAAAAAGRRPRVLLEWLSPGRRAAVVAAGVAANALLAAAFVAYQVVSYGELGVVVRPGARVRLAEGYGSAAESAELLAAEAAAEGTAASSLEAAVGERHAASGAEQEAEAAKQWRRLRAGDVVLRVGGTALPAGGDMDAAMVRALEKEALAAVAAAARGRGGAVGACGGAAATLEGVGMAVLRTAAPEAGDEAAASRRGRQEVLQMDAAEVLRYETLVVGPNSAAGYRRPGSATEAAHMLGREYYSWASVVLRSWAEAASAAVSFARGGSSQEAGAPAAAAQAGSSSSSVSGAGGSAQMVGPLGLVASAAAMAVAADRQSRAPSCYSCEQEAAGMAAGGGASGSGVAGATAESGSMSYSEQPPALLDLGIQLNLQLAAVNMLPLPVLDGGQLLLVALEAARGGRRLPAGVERWALVASALLVGGWVAALSLADVVGLADKAAGRLAVALTSSSSPHAAGSQHQRQLQLAVSVGGNSSSSSGGSSSGSGGVQGISRGFAADAAAALDAATGAWAV